MADTRLVLGVRVLASWPSISTSTRKLREGGKQARRDRHRAAAPEYWWAYALLLSTMIPSLVNLAIGGMALTRGIPWLARLLLQWIPEGKASR
jgi:hypothetical protein